MLVQIRASLLQHLQIIELFPFLVGDNLSEILMFGGFVWLVFGGLVFLFIAVAGDISGKINPGKNERIVVGVAGTILLVAGLISGAGVVGWGWGGGGEPTPTVTSSPTLSPTVDDAGEHEITSISSSPPSPATLDPGERVNVSFEYRTTEEDGVRIFVRPLTDGEETSGYRAHPSPLYSEGTGEGSGWFYFESEATVDQIRIQMWDEDQNELLYEESIRVNYRWTG